MDIRIPIGLVLGGCLTAGAGEARSATTPEDRFNYVIGTQTFSAAYGFTDLPRLLETARGIRKMGASVIKFPMSKTYHGPKGNIPDAVPGVETLTDLALEPSHREVLNMPFGHFILWAYPFTSGWWAKGYPAEERDREYQEMYAFACHLLRTYEGTGKAFYLGHWEGDWHLRQGYNAKDDAVVTDEAVAGMIAWLNTRQQAVDDAKRDTPHENVEVYSYCEVNLVKIAMQGRPSVTNLVLPKTNVDFVSYSSYDSGLDIKPALDYIESKLRPKPSVPGKRVFIGEYGFPAERASPVEQAEKSRTVMRQALEWGCPFVLYWEFYNNEVKEDGTQRGFWLIDDAGNKTPAYELHADFLEKARQSVRDSLQRDNRLPTPEEFRRRALEILAPTR
jgi:hypothetical protein